MPEQPVKGDEALRKMAARALSQPSSSQKGSEEGKDPLKEAQDFTKQMAANAIIEAEIAKANASVEEARARADEAKIRAEKARSGDTGKGEPPVSVTGKVDLGHFNYQEMLNRQQEEFKEMKKEADEQLGRQATVSDELRERLHAKEMEVLRTSFDAQMQAFTKLIETNASRGTFVEQYNAVMETAKTLGLSQPQGAGDINSQIVLKKMEFEQTAELRRMAREDKRADREFQRQLNRDAEEREARKAEQARQDKRDDMFARTPQVVGGAIAQGLLANQGRGGRRVTEETPPETKAPRGKQGHHVEAGWGESGEVECPRCNEPIAIGPTAKSAVCANCGERVPIRRTGERPVREEEE